MLLSKKHSQNLISTLPILGILFGIIRTPNQFNYISLIHCQIFCLSVHFCFLLWLPFAWSFVKQIVHTNHPFQSSIYPKKKKSTSHSKGFRCYPIEKNLPICQNKCTIAMKNKTPSPFEHWKMEFHLCKTLKIINNIFNLSYKHRINWKTFILTKSATELFSMFLFF